MVNVAFVALDAGLRFGRAPRRRPASDSLGVLPRGAVAELGQRHRRALASGGTGQAVRVLDGGEHKRDAGHDRLVLADVQVDVEEGHEQPRTGEHDPGDDRSGDAPDPGDEHDRQQADRRERRETVGVSSPCM